jgi:acetolactate synthase-1/3 small subunit
MISTAVRAGYSDLPRETEALHVLIISVEDRLGAVDRVVGTLRRKRAQMQSLSIGQSETPNVVRITALVKDTDISIDNLAEQVRKIIDVRQVTHLAACRAVIRELVLVKVATTADNLHGILAAADQCGATVVAIDPFEDTARDTITFELSGSEEKIANGISALQAYDIREIARSGCVATSR